MSEVLRCLMEILNHIMLVEIPIESIDQLCKCLSGYMMIYARIV